ncbi:MAG: tripartite tricarboxylate transporter substrate-binding protein [Roseococcus sp.]
MQRRALALSLPALLAAGRSHAQAFPIRPLRIMVGFSAATTSDLLARLIAQRLSEKLGQPVVVENREGAGGTIVAGQVARAVPDGYTLMLGASFLTMAPRLFRDVTFRPMEDFDPVGMIGYAPNVLVAGPNVPITSMAELLAAARAAPGRLRYASSGPGSGSWNGMEQLKALTGVELEEVPYSSTAQAATDLLSGQIELHFPSLAAAMPNIRTGRFRALGITSSQRSAGAPDIPAIAETVPGYDASSWYGVVGPARLPEPVAQRLNAELQAILAEAPLQARLRDAGVDGKPGSIAELRAIMLEGQTSGNALMDRIGFRPR